MGKQHHLILKTHNNTGLKYLCYHYGTIASCFKYRGSGKYWKYHLIKHGNNVSTLILETSDSKDIISEKGIEYSNKWNIVKSNLFANLIIEDAQKTASSIDYTTRDMRKKQRIEKDGHTQKELDFYKRISINQKGKTMKERLNDPYYIDPRKGKKFSDIYSNDYIHPRKGKKCKDIPQDCKPFKLIINKKDIEYFRSEMDFEISTGMSRLMISKIKKKDFHIIKRQSNSKHKYNNGDTITLIPISIDEFKSNTMFVR